MAQELKALEDWAGAFLEKLSPPERKRLAAQVARSLRTTNTRRMTQQQAPDGSRWESRKPPPPLKGRRKPRFETKTGPMMAKLKRAKALKAKGQADGAVVEFLGGAQRVARVHHFGETDNVNPGRGPRYDYPARELLGYGDEDLDKLRTLVLQHLKL